MCRALQAGRHTDDQVQFAQRLKELIGQDDYRVTGIHDDVRFERHVRGQLRTLVRMTKTNEGFDKTQRYR